MAATPKALLLGPDGDWWVEWGTNKLASDLDHHGFEPGDEILIATVTSIKKATVESAGLKLVVEE